VTCGTGGVSELFGFNLALNDGALTFDITDTTLGHLGEHLGKATRRPIRLSRPGP
jgi:hypothetical protein